MTPLTVLELVASSRGGGAVHVRDLSLGLDRARFAVQVAMPEDGGNVCREEFGGVPFHRVDISAGFSSRALWRIRGLADGLDTLHVHGARAALYGRLAAMSLGRGRPRVVYTIHGFAAPHYPAPRRQMLLAVERLLSRVTDAWICVSHAERNALLAAGVADGERIQVVWNGVDVGRFDEVGEQRGEVRMKLNVPAEAFVVTTVCRLHRPRDFETLLRAFQHLRGTVPRARLLIVGDGPLRTQVEHMVVELALGEEVRLLGMRHDVPQILCAADVFVLSSRKWEGLPLTVLEAMASSLPVIASDVGGTREAVVDGESGHLVPPGDVGALAQRLRAMADDPVLARRMGQRGLRRVKEAFTVRRMVSETSALYEELLS